MKENLFPPNDPFFNWRKTKDLWRAFQINVQLNKNDAKKINNLSKELNKKSFIEYAHRASREFDIHQLYLNDKGRTFLKSIRTDLNSMITQYNDLFTYNDSKPDNNLFNGRNLPKMQTTLNATQPIWNLYDSFVHIYGNERSKPQRITNPTKTRFCELVHISGLEKKLDSDNSKEAYCKRICKKYNIEYADNIRQYFEWDISILKHDEHIKNVEKQIFPLIPKKAQDHIKTYISNQLNTFG